MRDFFQEIRPLLEPGKLLTGAFRNASSLLLLAAGLLVIGLLAALTLRLRRSPAPLLASIPSSSIAGALFLWALDGTLGTLFWVDSTFHGFSYADYWQQLVLLGIRLGAFLVTAALVHYVCPESHRGRPPVLGLVAATGVVYADSLFLLLLVTPWNIPW